MILLSSSYLIIGHLLNLINIVALVHSVSTIYAGEWKNLKKILFIPFRQVCLIRPYITSVNNLALGLLVMAGLASLGVQMFGLPFNVWVSKVLFGSAFVALLANVGWSAIQNMGSVVSILEGKHEYIAIRVVVEN
ncbi:hypothetical protein LINGRAHAP2_LOCUS23050 [Linum grandiflorum]